jgi:hypothetical protein
VAQSNWGLVRDRAENVLALDPANPDAQAFLEAANRAIARPGAPAARSEAPAAPDIAPVGQTATPSSFANGRYQVKRFLGEGGKKKVYLAQKSGRKSGLAGWASA